MRFRALLFIVLLSGMAFGQGVSFQGPKIESQVPQPIAGLTISVCLATSTGTPCTPTVSVFSDSALAVPIVSLTTDGDGMFPTFFISPGQYQWCASDPTQGRISAYCMKFTAPASPSGGAGSFATLVVTGNSTLNGGTLNGTYAGNPTLSGTVTTCIINGIRQVGPSCYATIAACYAALSAGETCQIPPNYSETLAANLVLSKKKTTLQFMGGCAINEGAFNVQVSQGADDVSIITPFAHSSDQAGGNQGCMFLGYTGSGAAIDIGSSAGFTYNTLIRGLVVDLSSAQANAIGIRRTNGVAGPLEYDEVVGGGVSGQIGFQFVGTGALFDGTSNLVGLECNYSASSTNGKCVQFTGVNQNGYSFVGGHSNTGGAANGSVCIDAAAGSSKIDLGGFYCDVAATAVTVESVANTAVRGFLIVDSSVTLVANFAAGSNGNQIWTNTRSIGTQLVTDNGTAATNSVTNGFDMQWNSRRWRVISEAGGTGFQIIDQSDNSQMCAKGAGGATHCDSSAGNPFRTNQNSGAGVEFWNAGASVLTIDAGGTMHPGVVNTVGLGTTALPFKNVIIGVAATNNITLAGTATAARTQTHPDATGTVLVTGNGSTPIQTKRGVTGCATAASLNAVCSTTMTWATAFADANYTVLGCVGNGVTSGVPVLNAIGSKLAASITVQTLSITAAAAQYTTLECAAVHD